MGKGARARALCVVLTTTASLALSHAAAHAAPRPTDTLRDATPGDALGCSPSAAKDDPSCMSRGERDKRYDSWCKHNSQTSSHDAWCRRAFADRAREKAAREPDQAGNPINARSAAARSSPVLADPWGEGVSGTSPTCKGVVNLRELANCKRTGVTFRSQPTTNYGLDNYVEINPTNPTTWINTIFVAQQSFIVAAWQVLLYVLNGAFTLLEWAMGFDLTQKSMPDVHRAMVDINDRVLGTPYMAIALGFLALWATWGLARLRIVPTIGAIAVTLLLFAGAGIVIHDPEHTVGALSKDANAIALSMMSIASGGGVDRSDANLGDGLHRMYDVTVLPAWCWLQFGSEDFCSWHYPNPAKKVPPPKFGARDAAVCVMSPVACVTDGVKAEDAQAKAQKAGEAVRGQTVRDAWLRLPAGSDERKWLYHYTKAIDPRRVALMEEAGVVPRQGVMAITVLALIGLGLLFIVLIFRLLTAKVGLMIDLLLLPVVLPLAALGENGRAGFLTYVKSAVGKVFSLVVVVAILASTIRVANVVANLEISPFARIAILAMLSWIVLLKHNAFLQRLKIGEQGSGSGMMQAYGSYQLVKGLGQDAWRTGRRLGRAGTAAIDRTGAMASNAAERRRSRKGAADSVAREQVYERFGKQTYDDELGEAALARSWEPETRHDIRAVTADIAQTKKSMARLNRELNEDALRPDGHRDKLSYQQWVEKEQRLTELGSDIDVLKRERERYTKELSHADRVLGDDDFRVSHRDVERYMDRVASDESSPQADRMLIERVRSGQPMGRKASEALAQDAGLDPKEFKRRAKAVHRAQMQQRKANRNRPRTRPYR